ncbi:MAG: DUF2780 domain-containing protein [Desulfosarcinaceae bacterium]|nr:DUF2780 domain-containing protein [Desulfosarcinaceae bacterium]
MELLDLLTQQLGVSEDQARGGAGALFKLAQEQLGDGEFGQIADALPGVGALLEAAPESGGIGEAIGGLTSLLGGGKLGGLASLAGAFQGLGLDMDMIGKFVPVILSFAQERGGDGIQALLAGVLRQ